MIMKIFPLVSLVCSSRVNRQAVNDVLITDLESAVAHYNLIDEIGGDLINHGCHCGVLNGTETYGIPVDETDHLCRSWKAARKCVTLSGGACADSNGDPSYTITSQGLNSCDNLSGCQKALCDIDSHFQGRLKTMQTIFKPDAVCLKQNGQKKDSCCGDEPTTYKQYNKSDHKCQNGSVESKQRICTQTCCAKLVRQVDTSVKSMHPANDDLLGIDVYGTPGEGVFSVAYDYTQTDTFIFATMNHKYFLAMNRNEMGGSLIAGRSECETHQYGINDRAREVYKIESSDQRFVRSEVKTYNMCTSLENPWFPLRDFTDLLEA